MASTIFVRPSICPDIAATFFWRSSIRRAFFFAAEEDSFTVANFPGFVISDYGKGGGRGGEMNEEASEEDLAT